MNYIITSHIFKNRDIEKFEVTEYADKKEAINAIKNVFDRYEQVSLSYDNSLIEGNYHFILSYHIDSECDYNTEINYSGMLRIVRKSRIRLYKDIYLFDTKDATKVEEFINDFCTTFDTWMIVDRDGQFITTEICILQKDIHGRDWALVKWIEE